MENNISVTESSPKTQSVNQSRIVFKELDNIENAPKSPKAVSGTDQPEPNTKGPINLCINQPHTDTNEHSDNDKAINRELLRVSTPTDLQSSDDEFADCNTSFKSNESATNNSMDVTIQNETINFSAKIDASPIESNELDEMISVFEKKLNLGFNGTKTELANIEAEKSTANDSKAGEVEYATGNASHAESPNQNCTVIINEPLACEEDNYVRGSENLLSGDNKNTTVLVSASEPVIESEPTVELDTLSESKPIAEKQSEIIELPPATKSEPVIVLEPMAIPEISIESELVVKLDSGIETELLTGSEPAIDRDNGIDAVPVIIEKEALGEPFDASQTVIESVADNLVPEETKLCSTSENPLKAEDVKLSNLNETCTVPSSPSIVAHSQDSTFVSTNNQTAVVAELASDSQKTLVPEETKNDENPSQVENVKLSNLNETCTVPSSPSIVTRPQDSTFISTNNQTVVVAELASVSDSQEKRVPEETKNDENPSQVEDLKLSNLNETVPSSPSIVTRSQESTFVSTNNQTVLVESDSTEFDQKAQEIAEPEELSGNIGLSQLQKIHKFKANESISADSLEVDSLLDSLEMKQPQQDDPSTPTDRRLPVTTADRIFSSSSDCDRATNELNSKQWDSSFVTEKIDLANEESPNKPPVKKDFTCTDRLKRSDTFDVPVDSRNTSTNNFNETIQRNVVSSSSKNVECNDHLKPSEVVPNGSKTQMSHPEQSKTLRLNTVDFDYLESRGANTVQEDNRRSSLLLRFDPLAGNTTPNNKLPATVELSETVAHNSPKGNISADLQSPKSQFPATNAAEMSVSLIHDSINMDNETNSYVNLKTEDSRNADDVPMNDKKINLEYADVNVRKKMEEYEATQEILKKRLAEKEKTLAKNCAIIEAYEKTLGELVAEKEKLTEQHEIVNERLRQERDVHHQHLMSLEVTFSDLHKKYEHSKDVVIQSQERLDSLTAEKAVIDASLVDVKGRYEALKQHALERLEFANATLQEHAKNGERETSRLRALLKLEEVSRKTLEEQLSQKKKENDELVKICDELIGGGQRS